MDFDRLIERQGSGCNKWDLMERAFGVSPGDGLAMWVADADFRAPEFLNDAVRRQIERGTYGYFVEEGYNAAIRWWMRTRHDWDVHEDWIFTAHGLGNAIALALHCFTEPGDHVAIFTPVYHEFRNKVERAGRVATQLPLKVVDGIYQMDFAAYDAMMTGREKIALISSPHNPAGRVWTQAELDELAEFCLRHDLLLISDEIHQDLVFSGHRHLPSHKALPQLADRIIAMTAASKTFSIAGLRTGAVIIPDPDLRARFQAFFAQFEIRPNLFGVRLTEAAYSPEGAAWVDQLLPYLQENARILSEGLGEIPGVSVMPMQSTFLAWVDFRDTGMARDEFSDRIYKRARIAVTPGHTLGPGGETCMRFNVATSRANVEEAVSRMQEAFSDLQ